MQILKKTGLVSGLLFCACTLAAQDNTVQYLSERFTDYSRQTPQEKIFAHTDKSVYMAGEILWFKLYNVNASTNMPANYSKVAYVELLNRANKPVLQAKIALQDGSGSGSFYLPPGLPQDAYILRAYTNWMKNFSPDFFYEKSIILLNTKRPSELPATKVKSGWDGRFFPEGGNLVYNLASSVAFKVTDQYGKGTPCQGFILDGQDTVARFEPLVFGMGNFMFTPLPGHSYRAFIAIGENTLLPVTLPEILSSGYTMHLQQEDHHKIIVRVETNIPNADGVYLLVHTRQVIKAAMAGIFKNGAAEFLIEDSLLAAGISHFTVFTHDKQPVCERLYFSFPAAKLEIEATTGSSTYGIRDKVSIAVQSADQHTQPAAADMSLSVYRLDSLQGIDETGISDYLLLASDIKGNIESPAYYFKGQGNHQTEAMDNLMLTQGWRRFNWATALENKSPVLEFVPEYNGHIVTGKVINTNTGLPTKKMMAYLSIPSVWAQFCSSLSDSTGAVRFEMSNMYGSGEIIVQTNTAVDSLFRVDIANPFVEKYPERQPLSFPPAANFPHTLLDRQVGMQVQNIYLGEKLRRFAPSADTLPFFRKANASYLLDAYTRFITLEEVLREYVLAMNVRIKNNHFHLPVVDIRRNQFMEKDPLVLLDGVPIFDLDKFMKIDPLKIKKVDLVTGRYYLGQSTFEGILNFSTYKGDLNGFDLDPHATVIDYEGLQLQREFYMPVYDTKQSISDHLPDFRNVLYWSPEVKTGRDGKEKINFYTSDVPGKYAATLQGITRDGKCGTTTIIFEVKE